MTTRTVRTSATTDEMINWIVKTVKARSHKLITRATAKTIYDGIFERAITGTAEKGSFKLPYGWGSFYLRIIGQGAKPRKVPTGEMHVRKPKSTIRYKPGSAVRQILDGQPRLKPGRKPEDPLNASTSSPV